MSTGREDEHLLAVVRVVYTELGYRDASVSPSEAWVRGHDEELWEEGVEESSLVAQLREALAKLACAAEGDGDERRERAVQAALDGAELVMRAEIAARRQEMLGAYLPGFAFMVTLPGLGRKRAMAVSERVAKLVDGTGGTTASSSARRR